MTFDIGWMIPTFTFGICILAGIVGNYMASSFAPPVHRTLSDKLRPILWLGGIGAGVGLLVSALVPGY